MKVWLTELVVESETSKGKRFDLFIQGLILLNLISFSLSTISQLKSAYSSWFYGIEVLSIFVFTIEFLLRVVLAKRPIKFLLSFFGLIDLLAILPFYLTLGIDLRAFRAFRFLRIFRILKITRYSRAMKRYKKAFTDIKRELILFFVFSFIVIYISAVGIYTFESQAQPETFRSVFDGLWWAVATLTTVGYGDVYPITIPGKIFTYIILMIGLGIVAISSGLLASALSSTQSEN